MADVHEPSVRSFNMSRIQGKDTKPEILVRKFLHARGFRFRVHVKGLAGKPDIVLKKYNAIIFIHGCFWHGHEGCPYFKIPSTRRDWWKKKIRRTKELDKKNIKELRDSGWQVIEIWECELRPKKVEERLEQLPKEIIKGWKILND